MPRLSHKPTSPPSGGSGVSAGEQASDSATVAIFSLAELWPEEEREAVRNVEQLLAARDTVGAVLASDVLMMRVLAGAAALAGPAQAPRDPGVVWMLLGMNGGRWLRFRTLVRTARDGAEIAPADALTCLLAACEARIARQRIGA